MLRYRSAVALHRLNEHRGEAVECVERTDPKDERRQGETEPIFGLCDRVEIQEAKGEIRQALPTCHHRQGIDAMDPDLHAQRPRGHHHIRQRQVVRIPFSLRSIPALAFGAWLTPPTLGSIAAEFDGDSLNWLNHCHFGGVPGHEISNGPLTIAVHGRQAR